MYLHTTTIHRFAYIIPVCMKYTHYTRILGCFFLLCQPTHYSDGMPGLGSVPTGASATTFFLLDNLHVHFNYDFEYKFFLYDSEVASQI